jgi:uncharacterized membrane protein YozB (DUF420 family)
VHRRWFYTGMGIVAVLVVAIGFADSVEGEVTGQRSLTPLVHVHAAIFTSWLVLFIAQSTLVATGRTGVHRRLGVAGGVLAMLILVVGFQTSVVAARRGYPGNGDPLGFLVHPLGDLVSFAVLVGAALWFRHRREAHKRLMLLATIGAMMNAPLTHIHARLPGELSTNPIPFLLPMLVLLSTSAVYDYVSERRIHPVSLWGAILLFAWGNARELFIGPSDAWHRLAGWLVG